MATETSSVPRWRALADSDPLIAEAIANRLTRRLTNSLELDTQVFLLKRKSNGSEMSLMTLRC
jgi:hypothetical protein